MNSTRKKILIPMLALTIGGCAAVIISSILLFSNELNNAVRDKAEMAAMIAENEINELRVKAKIAAFGMANNPDLVKVLAKNDREGIIRTANALKAMAQIDFCNIIDNRGYVITRTHDPKYGDNISNQPHVKRALEGYSEAFVTQGAVIRLGAYAGAPIYDNDKNMIGVVSLGFRLDIQEAADRLKDLTKSEISMFTYNERVSTTLIDEENTYAVGGKISDSISERVLAGETYINRMQIQGKNKLAKFIPLHGINDKTVGMMFIGYDTTQDARKILFFIMSGLLITLAVLVVCVLIALFIARTVERKLENITELVAAKEAAEQNSRYKSAFLATMSHEIRTPMNTILGLAEIQMRDEKLTPSMEDTLEKIYESGDMLLNIINDVLDLSKIEAGKLELNPAKYDMPSLINDTVQLNRLRHESKPLTFITKVDENTPLDLLGDELRIKQVLNNILSNAFKYTDQGTVEFSVTSKTEPGGEGQEDNVTLIFRVADTGQGMNEEQLSKLFNEYTRFNSYANRTTTGAGLGMSITKRLLDMMQGEISVESEEGKGTVFTVSIPQKRTGQNVCGTDLVERLSNSSFKSTALTKKALFMREYMPYGSVLVVDDVESNLYVARGMLKPYGLKLETVTSGFAAIDKIKKGNVYDIVFMDHMMPRMDGIETTKIMREMGYTHKIVALTANALVGQREIYMQNGFDDFISKPLDSRELNLMLNEYIRNRKPPEVVEAARQERNELGIKITDTTLLEMANKAELKTFFVRDTENAINILEKLCPKIQNLDKGELETYITTVHGMKSALANMGEKELSHIAFKLELAGKERNINVIVGETQAFLDSLRAIITKYKPTAEVSHVDINDENSAYLREKLNDIKAACAGFDINAANMALNALKQKKWPNEISTVLENVAAHLLHSEFDEAEEKMAVL